MKVLFWTDVDGWPGSTHNFLLLGLSYKIQYCSPVMILRKKFFLLYRKSKFVQMSSFRFLFSTMSSWENNFPSFCIFTIACNWREIVELSNPSWFSSCSWVWHGCSSSKAWTSSSLNGFSAPGRDLCSRINYFQKWMH